MAEFLPALHSRGDVAQKLESDIILPKSAVKPEYRGSLVRSVRSLLGDRQAHVYRGPIVLGIRDVSRDLQFKSSYTLVEHAPEDSIELEIKAHALQQIERLEAAAKEGDFAERFRLLGTAEAQRSIDSDGEAPTEYTRVENTTRAGQISAPRSKGSSGFYPNRNPVAWKSLGAGLDRLL